MLPSAKKTFAKVQQATQPSIDAVLDSAATLGPSALRPAFTSKHPSWIGGPKSPEPPMAPGTSRMECQVTIEFYLPGTQPPVYIGTDLSKPQWRPVEMDSTLDEDGEYRFSMTFDATEGEYQYKLRLGPGDWWICDDSVPKVTDDAGNENNSVIVKAEEDEIIEVAGLEGDSSTSTAATKDAARQESPQVDTAQPAPLMPHEIPSSDQLRIQDSAAVVKAKKDDTPDVVKAEDAGAAATSDAARQDSVYAETAPLAPLAPLTPHKMPPSEPSENEKSAVVVKATEDALPDVIKGDSTGIAAKGDAAPQDSHQPDTEHLAPLMPHEMSPSEPAVIAQSDDNASHEDSRGDQPEPEAHSPLMPHEVAQSESTVEAHPDHPLTAEEPQEYFHEPEAHSPLMSHEMPPSEPITEAHPDGRLGPDAPQKDQQEPEVHSPLMPHEMSPFEQTVEAHQDNHLAPEDAQKDQHEPEVHSPLFSHESLAPPPTFDHHDEGDDNHESSPLLPHESIGPSSQEQDQSPLFRHESIAIDTQQHPDETRRFSSPRTSSRKQSIGSIPEEADPNDPTLERFPTDHAGILEHIDRTRRSMQEDETPEDIGSPLSKHTPSGSVIGNTPPSLPSVKEDDGEETEGEEDLTKQVSNADVPEVMISEPQDRPFAPMTPPMTPKEEQELGEESDVDDESNDSAVDTPMGVREKVLYIKKRVTHTAKEAADAGVPAV